MGRSAVRGTLAGAVTTRGLGRAVAATCLAAVLVAGPAARARQAAEGDTAMPSVSAPVDARARYKALVAAAELGGQPVDWQALRFAYADSPEFDFLGVRTWTLQDQMFKAFDDGRWQAAIDHATAIIALAYVDIDAHVICDLAYRELGNATQADRHRTIARGLIQSIMTGDGKSPAGAFTVITIREEYTLLSLNGMKPQRQVLMHEGDHSYDVLDVLDVDGKPQSIYFQIDRVLAAEAHLKAKP